MAWLWFLFGIVVSAAIANFLAGLRPTIRRFEDGLNVIVSIGYNNAELHFIHGRSGRKIVARKEMVAGVPQLLLLTRDLKLSASEQECLRSYITTRNLTAKKLKGKQGEAIILGHSAKAAAEVVVEIANSILHLSRHARFKVRYKRLKLRNSRGDYVEVE
jgi:hypothetical protein